MIKLEGYKELEAELKKLGREAKKITRQATLAGAAVVRKAARENLKANANVGASSVRSIVAKIKEKTNYSVTYSIGARADHFYLNFIETGTSEHLIRPKKKNIVLASEGTIYGPVVHHPGQHSKPWLRPAIDNNQNKILDKMKDTFWKGILKAKR